jgi:hypothetical protein
MKIDLKGLAVLYIAASSLSCGGGAPQSSPQPPATTVAPAATAALSDTAAGEFGVPECDSYFRKYKACLDTKVPESVKPMLKQTFDQTATAWRQAAATPQGKAGLASGCIQAEAMAKQSMAAYGCTW